MECLQEKNRNEQKFREKGMPLGFAIRSLIKITFCPVPSSVRFPDNAEVNSWEPQKCQDCTGYVTRDGL